MVEGVPMRKVDSIYPLIPMVSWSPLPTSRALQRRTEVSPGGQKGTIKQIPYWSESWSNHPGHPNLDDMTKQKQKRQVWEEVIGTRFPKARGRGGSILSCLCSLHQAELSGVFRQGRQWHLVCPDSREAVGTGSTDQA